MRRLCIAVAATVAALTLHQAAACSRRAEIADEPIGGDDLVGPQLDAGPIPEIDAGLAAFPPCDERTPGGCQGPIDFPCNVSVWVEDTAKRCQRETSCITDGRLEVILGDDGCVASIGMDFPNDDIVACLAAELGAHRCPCDAGSVTYLFGYGNDGVCPTECAEEFPCDAPLECVDGVCVAP